jgi:hypothetical protein
LTNDEKRKYVVDRTAKTKWINMFWEMNGNRTEECKVAKLVKTGANRFKIPG